MCGVRDKLAEGGVPMLGLLTSLFLEGWAFIGAKLTLDSGYVPTLIGSHLTSSCQKN